MQYVLTENLKRRLILELRDFWSRDPKYKDSLCPNIQGKYSFDERPQQGIIVKTGSANPTRFSADNYQGTVESYCNLTKAYGKQGTSIEWVREDGVAIQKNQGRFPSLPGVYYLEVRAEPYTHQGVTETYLVFYVDPLYAEYDENPSQLDTLRYQVRRERFQRGSLVVYELPGNLLMYEGVNYSADPATGILTLAKPLPPNTNLSVDYYWAGESTGPHPVPENGADNKAIPGVVLAFGRRAFDGDIQAVVITKHREGNTLEYGGKFEMSVDMDIMARDVHAQGEITDRTLMFLQHELRDRLSYQGIEIDQVSSGGESEEAYDENGDDYFYNASISLTVLTDWKVHVPLSGNLRRLVPGTLKEDQILSAMDPDQIAEAGSPTGFVYLDRLGLQVIQDPWFLNRDRNYELIR